MMMRNETLSSASMSWTARSMDAWHAPRRETWSGEAMVRFDDTGEGMLFDAVRISTEGMFLLSNILFEPGDTMTVSFASPDGDVMVAEAEVTEIDFGELEPFTAGMELSFVTVRRAS